MTRLLLTITWLLSGAPMLLDRLLEGGFGPASASRLGLAFLPWIALAGLPRPTLESQGERGFSSLAVTAFALPLLALGAGLDFATGRALADLLLMGGGGALLVALLAAGADAARPGERARASHALLWLILLPGSAALIAALRWGASPGTGSVWAPLAELGRWNPLLWIHGASGALESPSLLGAVRPLVAVALLALVPRLLARREGEAMPAEVDR